MKFQHASTNTGTLSALIQSQLFIQYKCTQKRSIHRTYLRERVSERMNERKKIKGRKSGRTNERKKKGMKEKKKRMKEKKRTTNEDKKKKGEFPRTYPEEWRKRFLQLLLFFNSLMPLVARVQPGFYVVEHSFQAFLFFSFSSFFQPFM